MNLLQQLLEISFNSKPGLGGGNGNPLKTYVEVAEMFGTDSHGMNNIRVAFDVPFPEPKLRHGANAARGKVQYFDPTEIKTWVKQVREKFGVDIAAIRACAKGFKKAGIAA